MRITTHVLLAVCLLSTHDLIAAQPQRNGSIKQVPQWTRFETQFVSSQVYENAVQDIEVKVEFQSPSGKKHEVQAFWDGEKIWKVRFSPEELGKWTYRSRASKSSDTGLNNQSGTFTCIAYSGVNPIYRHGAIRLSNNRHHLVHANGKPFFWLGDTTWNGALLSDTKGWETYLSDRASKGFNVVKFVTTQWLAAGGNAEGRQAYAGKEKIMIDPIFYQRIDERIDAINKHGLVAAPVLVWAARWNPLGLDMSPGTYLPDDQIILLTRYMVARYGAHQVVWILGGDADYRGDKADRWKKIGREVFGDNHHRLVTMHPGGSIWVANEFRKEPWFSFNGYQSGHESSEPVLSWIIEGPPNKDWDTEPHVPIINLEPNYEAHRDFATTQDIFNDHAIRRAAYWSLLSSPTAGVSYGGHGVWSWEVKPAIPMNHVKTRVARPWYEAIKLPGSVSMKHLRNLFHSIEWWRLRPAPQLIADQPGKKDVKRFIAAAQSETGDVAIIYLPEGNQASINMSRFSSRVTGEWFDPATGIRSIAGSFSNEGIHQFITKGGKDKVLILRTSASKRVIEKNHTSRK